MNISRLVMINARIPPTQIFGIFWTIFGIVAITITAFVPAFADQNDPQLDDLFNALQASPSKTQAANLVLEIWTRWDNHPDDPLANRQMTKGIKLMNSGHLDAAEAVFSRIINKHPNFAEAWNKRATVRFFLGNDNGSAGDILQVIKLEPRHFGALSGLGMIRVRVGDLQGALKAYQAAQRINPYLPQIETIIDQLSQKLKGRAL
jgi:tetratricopeptide (TPR) repeat protein